MKNNRCESNDRKMQSTTVRNMLQTNAGMVVCVSKTMFAFSLTHFFGAFCG